MKPMNHTHYGLSFRIALKGAAFLFFVSSPVYPSTNTVVESWVQELPRIRLAEEDVKVPRGWPPEFTIPAVENLFAKPFQTPILSSDWLDRIEEAGSIHDLILLGYTVTHSSNPFPLLSLTLTGETLPEVPPMEGIEGSKDLQDVLQTLYRGLKVAKPPLAGAVQSIGPDEKKGFLNFMEFPTDGWVIKQEISSRRIRKMIAGMKNFKEDEVYVAGGAMARSIDEILPVLQKLTTSQFDISSPLIWKTDAGQFLIKGKGNDVTSEDELKEFDVILDLGGNNTYTGPAAGARENEIRLVIDYGSSVTIEGNPNSNTRVASGIFGLGFLILPNPEGVKKISASSFSQGCGVGGIGVLFTRGKVDVKGNRYAQGVGAFGLGIIKNELGDDSTFTLDRNGQGAGFVRGLGVFSLSGNRVQIKGGLIQPDPREPLGTVSICQGMGYGHRGYAGGGVGIMALKGDNSSIEGSYFAQGCGYWHGLGLFRFKGDNSKIQARRYDQGTGVHYAFGHFQLAGNNNRVLNWGVGPAFGWDRSFGSAIFLGDENEIQVDWGAGAGAIGSWSASFIDGRKNRLQIPQWGEGGFYRNEFGRAIHIIKGEDNILKHPSSLQPTSQDIFLMGNSWGVVRAGGTQFQTDLSLEPPVWGQTSNEDYIQREMADLEGKLWGAGRLKGLEKVADLLDVAAAFSLDKINPRKALEELLVLPPSDVPHLIELLDPIAVDHLIKLDLVIAAFGKRAAQAIIEKINSFDAQKRGTLLNQLSHLPPSKTVPFLLRQAKKGTDENTRISATRILGQIMNSDTGNEPGARAALKALATHLKNTSDLETDPKPLLKFLGRLHFSDSMGLFSTVLSPSNDEKMRFLAKGPEDITETLGEKGAGEFIQIINAHAGRAKSKIEAELKVLEKAESELEKNLFELLASTSPQKIQTAIITIGQLARPIFAPPLAPFLQHENGSVREMAAVALARIGEAGFDVLQATMDSIHCPSVTKNLVLASVPHAVIPQASELIYKGLEDHDPFVRLNAVAALKNLPPLFEPIKEETIRKAKRILAGEKDESVLLAIQAVK